MGNKISIIIAIALFICFGMVVMVSAATSSTSVVSVAIKWIGIVLACLCFVKPKLGIYVVAAEAFTTDFLKKVAVYYGNTSYATIIEVMSVVMLALIATYLGRLAQVFFRQGNRFSLPEIILYAIGVTVSLVVFVSQKDGGFVKAGQAAFNSGVYLGTSGLMLGLFVKHEELMHYLKFILVFALIWALWAIKQSLFGFSDLEWYYADTGLSPVATKQMYLGRYEEPRAFGLGSGAPNYNVMSVFVVICFAISLTEKRRRNKIVYGAMMAIVLVSIILVKGKGNIVISFALPIFYLLLRSKRGICFFWVSVMSFLLILVMSAGYLLDNWSDINQWYLKTFNLSSEWSINTFAERLKGYENLADPVNWSLFGGVEMHSHDTLTKTLGKIGAVGVIGILFFCALIFINLSKAILRKPTQYKKSIAAMAAAAAIGLTIKSIMGGSGFLSQPIPFMIGVLIGVCLFGNTRQNQSMVVGNK